jgi:mono/diheme cytochrome c family protein
VNKITKHCRFQEETFMKKSIWVLISVIALSSLLLAACSGGGATSSSSSADIKATVVRNQIPADYANLTNKFAGNADAVAAGKEIFTANCVTCHGDKGLGDGPAGASLDPKPANLQNASQAAGDTYMHWVISEGGAAAGFSPSMASYKGTLSDDDIWKVITYIKTLK